jgi:hypothetical protein
LLLLVVVKTQQHPQEHIGSSNTRTKFDFFFLSFPFSFVQKLEAGVDLILFFNYPW